MIVTILDVFVRVFNFLSLERRISENQSVSDDPDGPNISFEGVASFGENLGADVVWGAAKGRSALFMYWFCQAEVTDLDLEVLVDQKISEL